MHFVVTGGTGFVGSELVRQLLARGDAVTVLTRGQSAGNPGATAKTWSPTEPGDWMKYVEAVDGVPVDAIVHLAGKNLFDGRWTDAHLEECRQSRVRSTELLAQAIAKATHKPRVFVSCSAVGIYGIARGADRLDETSAPGDPSEPLAGMTLEWEAAAAPARAAGVRVVHPRIGIVLGKGEGVLGKLEPPFRAFVGGPLGNGEQYIPWIHVVDAARALLHAVDTESMQGAFNVCAPEAVTMNHLATVLGHVLDRPSVMRVPAFALKLALGRAAPTVLTGQRAVPAALEAAGFTYRFADLEAALRDILGPP